MKLTGKIKDGKLSLYDRKALDGFISENEGEVWIEIRNAPKSRSPQQNGYYRTIIRKAGKHFGYTTNEMHQDLKKRFHIDSTKSLSVDQFSEYLDLIIRLFAEMDFPVEDPRRATPQ